ncbi:protein of unknown function, partial [Taphrina deformans PYCC 5710]
MRRTTSNISDTITPVQRSPSDQSFLDSNSVVQAIENSELRQENPIVSDQDLDSIVMSRHGVLSNSTEEPEPLSIPSDLESLRTKIVDLETQRTNDIRRLSSLGALEAEKQAWSIIKTKLREKLQSQQVDIKLLRDRIKVLEEDLSRVSVPTSAEDGFADEDSREALEMAMLDREMAEEQRDQLQADLRETMARNDELVLELEIYKESKELADTHTEHVSGIDTRAITQQNERLREALIRLKELSNEQEERLITSLNEHEILQSANTDFAAQLSSARSQLAEMSALVEDLREQLELQIGAEEMLETLTDRNLSLGEELEMCKAEIADLEILKSLNDELDEDHLHVRRELEKEVQQQSLILSSQTVKLKDAECSLIEYASTVKRFQDFVKLLQAEIQEMKRQGQQAVNENAKASQQAADLLAKNIDLQRLDRHAIVRNMENELRVIDVTVTVQHLDIIRDYLPTKYETDKTAVESFSGLVRLNLLLKVVYQATLEDVKTVDDESQVWLHRSLLIVLEAQYWTQSSLAAIRCCTIDDFPSCGQFLASISQNNVRLQTDILDIGKGLVPRSKVLSSLCSVRSAVEDIYRQQPNKNGIEFHSCRALVADYVEVWSQALQYLCGCNAASDNPALKRSVEESRSALSEYVATIKSQCSQLQRQDTEMSARWRTTSLTRDTCLSDLMSIILSIAQGIERVMKGLNSEKESNHTDFSTILGTQVDPAFEKLSKTLELLITQVKSGQPVHEEPSAAPWTLRALKWEEEKDISAKDEQQL